MGKCNKKFLFLKWEEHNYELVDIKDNVKIIGKKYNRYDTGIFVRRFKTKRYFKCINCGHKKIDEEIKEETQRQYH